MTKKINDQTRLMTKTRLMTNKINDTQKLKNGKQNETAVSGETAVWICAGVGYRTPAGLGFLGSNLATWTLLARPILESSQMP
jgi:hypothetical protein